jgi:hypothetical protein
VCPPIVFDSQIQAMPPSDPLRSALATLKKRSPHLAEANS